jgi:pimeloyl-ACP methyl ester carboxylesterase
MATTTVNGVDLYYEATGTGEPLVLIHGSWGDHANWAHVAQPLATHHRVITYDRRGHSASAPATGTTEDDVADTAALIEQVAGGRAHVYGNSYGGVIALRLAATRPDLVRTVAVHEPPAFGLLAGEQHDGVGVMTAELAAVLDLIRTGAFRDAARQFVDRVAFGPGAWDVMPEEFRQVLTRNAPTFLEEADDPETDFIDITALARAGVPVRLSHGDQSLPAFRDVVYRIATDVPSATVVGLGATGHVPQVTHPQLMTESLLAWLRPAPNATPT